MSDSHKFSGKVLKFNIGKSDREYILGVIRFGYLRQFAAAEPFNAKTGKGEQRAVIMSHARALKKAMMNGTFAPTVFTLGTRQLHRDVVSIKDGTATLEVSKDNPLPVLDANNRTAALEAIREMGDAEKSIVDNLYIPYILYLNGNLREDFVNLQAGKPVSRDHMLSIRIAAGLIDDNHAPFFKIAQDVSQILHSTPDSFCHNLIKTDSRNNNQLPLSLNSLCTKGASELGFSLYGGAKIAAAFGKDADWLSDCILTAWRAIKNNEESESLLDEGNILCPAPSGSKAGTTLLISLGNMLASRLYLKGIDEPEDTDIQLLIDCAVENLSEPTHGNTSADSKRTLFNKFCVDFFGDILADTKSLETDEDEDGLDVPKGVGAHENIPVALIRLLSASTFNVSKLPSERKTRGRPPKVVSAAIIEPDDDDLDVDVDGSRVSYEDPIDAAAFAEEDARTVEATSRFSVAEDEETAPWDEEPLD